MVDLEAVPRRAGSSGRGQSWNAPPRILLAATSCWAATARLAKAFVVAGCSVEVVCPRGHPVTRTGAAARVHRYHVFAPLRSVEAAIRAARPDLIIPCDDLARSHLAHLHERGRRRGDSAAGIAVLEDSLGEASSMSVATGRSDLIAVARALGVRAPATAVARSRQEVRDWLVEYRSPVVLKTDGSYGGGGVQVVDSLDEADRAWRALSAPPSLGRAIKRAIVNRDMTETILCIRRRRPVVNMQTFVPGQDANCTVACWKGNVLASITVSVLETVSPRGPASVVRVIENREVSAAVDVIVRRLKLSGLIGLDFIFEERNGDAYLIEMNPRAPQICHLQLGTGRDLPGSLRAALTGDPPRGTLPVTESDVIALFPQEWLRDPASEFLRTAYHDVPWDEPDLVRACIDEVIVHRIRTGLSRQVYEAPARLAGAKRRVLGRRTGRPWPDHTCDRPLS